MKFRLAAYTDVNQFKFKSEQIEDERFRDPESAATNGVAIVLIYFELDAAQMQRVAGH